MVRRLAAVVALLLIPGSALAQQPPAPVPFYPGTVPRGFEEKPLPPSDATPAGEAPIPLTAPPLTAAASAAPSATSSPDGRVFCEQPVAVQLADPDQIPERYRNFLGIFSDAAWTPQLCAALVVENVTPDGTASIVYVFGPMAPSARSPGGILHGTGIIREGELKFQNSDGSQFAFRPLYADLQGRYTTPQGQSYDAIFKKTP